MGINGSILKFCTLMPINAHLCPYLIEKWAKMEKKVWALIAVF